MQHVNIIKTTSHDEQQKTPLKDKQANSEGKNSRYNATLDEINTDKFLFNELKSTSTYITLQMSNVDFIIRNIS